MKEVPIVCRGSRMGTLTLEQKGLYVLFSAACQLPGDGLWYVWAIGETGELRLGILEPGANGAAMRKKLSQTEAAPAGTILRGEIRPQQERESDRVWQRAGAGDLFRTPWLRDQIRGRKDVLISREGERTLLALPYCKTTAFPLPPLFCFARLIRIGGRAYVQYGFDPQERPVFEDF